MCPQLSNCRLVGARALYFACHAIDLGLCKVSPGVVARGLLNALCVNVACGFGVTVVLLERAHPSAARGSVF